MRNPNGYGSVKKLSGNRRRPYIFVVSETGKRRVVGFYETQVEALIAQTDYNIHHNHPRLRDNKMTFLSCITDGCRITLPTTTLLYLRKPDTQWHSNTA